MSPLLVIAGSTGAPSTMASILKQLPAEFSLPIILLLHLDGLFIDLPYQTFANSSSRKVLLIEERMAPEPNTVHLAAKNEQLLLCEGGFFHYRLPLRSERYCPSIDLLFESMANHSEKGGIALLLSGMGKDGAAGLKLLHNKGWYTIVEDPSSCIIGGMPQAAIDAKAASSILKGDLLVPAIIEQVKKDQTS